MPPIRRAAARGLLLCLLAATSAAASAQSNLEAAAGPSFTRNNEDTVVAALAWLPELRPMTNASLRWDLGATWVDGRGDVPGFDLDDDVVVAHAGLRYERTDNGLTLGAAVGAQAGETDALSGDPQFVTTAGWRWSRFSVLVRHISNASLHQPNDGETMVLGAWRF